MLRLVLLALFLVLVLMLAISSWRLGQKVLAVVLVVIAVSLGGVGGWLGLRGERVPAVAADTLSIHLDSANRTAQGWRLTGELANNGSVAVSSTTVAASVHACAAPDWPPIGRFPAATGTTPWSCQSRRNRSCAASRSVW